MTDVEYPKKIFDFFIWMIANVSFLGSITAIQLFAIIGMNQIIGMESIDTPLSQLGYAFINLLYGISLLVIYVWWVFASCMWFINIFKKEVLSLLNYILRIRIGLGRDLSND